MASVQALDFRRKPSVEGELVLLRPVTVADVPVLHAGMANLEMARLTGAIHSTTEGLQQRWSVAKHRGCLLALDDS
jgi:hypothetical protein